MSRCTRGSVRRVGGSPVVEAERADGVAFVDGSDCGEDRQSVVERKSLALLLKVLN